MCKTCSGSQGIIQNFPSILQQIGTEKQRNELKKRFALFTWPSYVLYPLI